MMTRNEKAGERCDLKQEPSMPGIQTAGLGARSPVGSLLSAVYRLWPGRCCDAD